MMATTADTADTTMHMVQTGTFTAITFTNSYVRFQSRSFLVAVQSGTLSDTYWNQEIRIIQMLPL